jgi:hypothetical protein
MSGLGQKQTCRPEIAMSALPSKADIPLHYLDVRFGPRRDIDLFLKLVSNAVGFISARLPNPLPDKAQ